MANFLSRLAARALGTGPVAQPLIPSVFAGRPSVEQHEAAAPEWWSYADRENFTPRDEPYRQARTASPVHDFPHLGRNRAPISESSLHEEKFEVETLASLPMPETESQNLPQQTDLRPIRPHSTITDNGTYSQSQEQRAQDAPENTSHPLIETHRTAPSEVFARSEARRANAPATQLAGAFNQGSRREQLVEPPPQIVRVTIGRVDVRAQFTTPQTPPVKSVRRPTMSLEDYARQRSEGKR